MLKGKHIDVPKKVEQIRQIAYDRKKKKNTIQVAVIWNWERKIKEEPIHKWTYIGKYGTRKKEKPEKRNGRFCNAPNWNSKHKCPTQESTCHNCKKKGQFPKTCRFEHQKQQKIEEITEPVETRESGPHKSIDIITEKKHVTDRRTILPWQLKNDGTKKIYRWHPTTGHKNVPEKKISKRKESYFNKKKNQGVNNNWVNFARKITVQAENRGIRKNLPILITKQEAKKPPFDVDLLREVNWMMQKFESTTETTDKSENMKILTIFDKLFKTNRTVNGTGVKIQFIPGHPTKSKKLNPYHNI